MSVSNGHQGNMTSLTGSSSSSLGGSGCSPRIKRFISAAYDYFVRESDQILVQRQLQVLSVEDDLSIFEPTCMEMLDFYDCLAQLLTKPKARSLFGWKVVTLIIHITNSRPVLLALRDEIHLLPVVSEFLQEEKLSRDKYAKTLSLLQRLSHGCKIERTEAWLLWLLPQLVELVVVGGGGKGEGGGSRAGSIGGGSALVYPSLATLTNLCRDSPAVLHGLRRWSDTNNLVNSLLTQQSSSRQQQLLCLELYHLIQASDPVTAAAAVAAQPQGVPAVQLVLCVCRDGLSHGEGEAVQLATDALRSLAALPHLHDSVRSFKQFGKETQGVLELLSSSGREDLPEAAAFLAVLVSLNLPQLGSLFPQIMQRAVSWVQGPSSCCSSAGLQLLLALLDAAENRLLDQHLQDFITAAKHQLHLEGPAAAGGSQQQQVGVHRLSQLVDALRVLQVLATRDTTFALSLTLSVSPDLLSGLVGPLLDHHAHLQQLRQRGRLVSRKYHQAAGPAHLMDALNCSSGSTNTGTDGSCSDQHHHHSGSSSSGTTRGLSSSDGSLLCSEAILRLLAVFKTLAKQDGPFMLHYNKLMSSGRLMPHVVWCQGSHRRDLVSLAAYLLYDSALLQDSLDALVNATLEVNLKASAGAGGELMDCSSSSCLVGRSLGDLPSPVNSDGALMARLDDVMTRLKSLTSATDMEGQPLTELVELYEFKLATTSDSEEAMRDLLTAAERNSRLLQRSLLQAKTENARVRQLLLVWEQRVQAERKLKEEALEGTSQLQEQAKKFRETLIKEKAECERESSRLRGSLKSARVDLQSRDEELCKLQALHREAVSEGQSWQRAMEQEKAAKEAISTELAAVKIAQGASQQQLEALQKDHSNLEKAHGKLKQELTDLEKTIKDLERLVYDKDQQIDELTKTNDGLKRIQDMIHNISAQAQMQKH